MKPFLRRLVSRPVRPSWRLPPLALGLGVFASVVAACGSAPTGDLDEGTSSAAMQGAGDAGARAHGQKPAKRPHPGTRPSPLAASGVFGAPLAGLTTAELGDFAAGLEEFQNQENAAGGLGPSFNDTSCVACHGSPAAGGSANINVTRFGKVTRGVFDALESRGGSLLQSSAIEPLAQEVVPADANVRAFRQSTPLFGLGLIEAIDDSAIVQNAGRPTVTNVHGTVSMVTDVTTGRRRVGRFGWKAQVATLLHFSGDAYVNEMGVTSRFFPTENAPNGDLAKLAATDRVADPEDQVDPVTGKGDIDHAADFMRLLAPPPTLAGTASRDGESLFQSTGCADCHTPILTTGSNAIAALARKEVRLYSDLLLHDMGALGDGIVQGSASGTQMKTPPLWGVRVSAPYLHDGRAATLDAAILAHAGEGAPSRNRYAALSTDQRTRLLSFLGTL